MRRLRLLSVVGVCSVLAGCRGGGGSGGGGSPQPPATVAVTADAGDTGTSSGLISLLGASSAHLLAPGSASLSNEYDGSVSFSGTGNRLHVPAGQVATMSEGDLEAGSFSEVEILGTLTISALSSTTDNVVEIVVAGGDVEITGSIEITVNARVVFRPTTPTQSVSISGSVNCSPSPTATPAEFEVGDGPNTSTTRFQDVRLDGSITARSTGAGREVILLAENDLIIAGDVNVSGIGAGSGGFVTASSLTRLVVRANRLSASGLSNAPGGTVQAISAGSLDVGADVTLSADGGSPGSGVGADGGVVLLEGSLSGDLDSITMSGTLTANGGFGDAQGDGGIIYLGEDPSSSTSDTLNNGSVAGISGTIEATGDTGGSVDFHVGTLNIAGSTEIRATTSGVVATRPATTVDTQQGATISPALTTTTSPNVP